MTNHGRYRHLGRTLDDAAGEAFDKGARLLGLGFPGGPAIQNAAGGRRSAAFELPRAWLGDTDDFSSLGLKTALLRLDRALPAYSTRHAASSAPTARSREHRPPSFRRMPR